MSNDNWLEKLNQSATKHGFIVYFYTEQHIKLNPEEMHW